MPVVVLDDAVHAPPLAAALVAGGLPVAEVTFRTAAAAEAIRVTADRGDVLLGADTPTEVQAALELGLKTVTFFPAATSGAAAAIAALAAPFGAVGFRPDRGDRPGESGPEPRRRRGSGGRRLLDGAARQHPGRGLPDGAVPKTDQPQPVPTLEVPA